MAEFLFRLAKSAYGMRQWAEAIEHLESILREFPNKSSETQPHLDRAEARLKETTSGEYNVYELYKDSSNGKMQLDHADYHGPVRMEAIPGKGEWVQCLVKGGCK